MLREPERAVRPRSDTVWPRSPVEERIFFDHDTSFGAFHSTLPRRTGCFLRLVRAVCLREVIGMWHLQKGAAIERDRWSPRKPGAGLGEVLSRPFWQKATVGGEPLANRWLPLPSVVAGAERRRVAKARRAPSIDLRCPSAEDELPDGLTPAPTRPGVRRNDDGREAMVHVP